MELIGDTMIPRRLITALLVAILISGGVTLWLIRRFASVHTPAASRRYVTAAQNMEAGETVKLVNLQLQDWPAASSLDGGFSKPEDVAGRTLLYPLSKGQPVIERQLYTGTGAGLSIKIPDGMRAISLKSDQVVGVAGFLLPGTHIDVLVTYHTINSPDPMTSTVLQDTQILAAGQKLQPDPDGKATAVDVVTLLVTPQDAERVTLASAQGTVHFVLRNGVDHQQLDDTPAHLSDLGEKEVIAKASPPLRLTVPRPAAVKAPESFHVQILRGDKQTVETFQ